MKAVLRAVKNQAYEPIEVLVRDATSNEPQGASSTDMETIAKATHNYQEYELLFRMLWKR
jgi:epsin